jgi:hypothetical protein
VRPSVRFDVFKRDSFTCSYCGRIPPTVTLEVDHLIPCAEGGTDDPENLVTACWDCNRGKGATPLDREPSAIPDLKERTELVREREAQLRAYHEAKREEAERRDAQVSVVWNHWFKVWDAETLARYYTPWESTLRKYVDLIGPDEVMHAMDITRQKFSYVSTNAVRYFVGVLKGRLAAAEGREKQCTICGDWLRLEPGQDITGNYHHTACELADG